MRQQGVKPNTKAPSSCINGLMLQLNWPFARLPASPEELETNETHRVRFENVLEMRVQTPAPLWSSLPQCSYLAPPGFYSQWTWNQRRHQMFTRDVLVWGFDWLIEIRLG